jgi:hypothetical protein
VKARKIAEADQADPRAVEGEAPFRAVEKPFLLALAHCAVCGRHARQRSIAMQSAISVTGRA